MGEENKICIFSILSIVLTFTVILSPIGLILGIIAIKKIKNDLTLSGNTLAIIAIVISSIFTILLIAVISGAVFSYNYFSLPSLDETESDMIGKMQTFEKEMVYCPLHRATQGLDIEDKTAEYEIVPERFLSWNDCLEVDESQVFRIIKVYSNPNYSEDGVFYILEDESGVKSLYNEEYHKFILG